jgi:hypothetical protein
VKQASDWYCVKACFFNSELNMEVLMVIIRRTEQMHQAETGGLLTRWTEEFVRHEPSFSAIHEDGNGLMVLLLPGASFDQKKKKKKKEKMKKTGKAGKNVLMSSGDFSLPLLPGAI